MPVKPSFTDEVKAEVANVQPARPCCQEAELAAMVGALAGPGEGAPTTLRIPRNAGARKVVHLARAAGGQVEAVRKGPTDKRPTYRLGLRLPGGRGSSDPCCARAILRGAFLARGVMGNPADAYHLEIATPAKGDLLAAGAAPAGITVKRTTPPGRPLYYLKGADPISPMLGLVGAHPGVVGPANERSLPGMRSPGKPRGPNGNRQ